ncbi:hypothetical protein AQ1_01608 [alpha proteobacterium Q-1]|nr:hypothetical protein [Iodidimonas nitroreducens]GAK33718.1 hypothetical protein AQ1_01608 [alpha proteobacterium Q-1]
MTHQIVQSMEGWKLEDGTPVTADDLAREITLVPRTRFWRLSHIALLWPRHSDPDSTAQAGGFADGYALELTPAPDGVIWLLQPVNGDPLDRQTGFAPNGRAAVMAAFDKMSQDYAQKQARALISP